MAPPIPYGHYAKGPSDYLGKHFGCLTCGLGGLHGKLCQGCGGKGCADCGGSGIDHGHSHGGLHKGGGLFHHGDPNACGMCGGIGCGLCRNHIGGGFGGLFHHNKRAGGLCARRSRARNRSSRLRKRS